MTCLRLGRFLKTLILFRCANCTYTLRIVLLLSFTVSSVTIPDHCLAHRDLSIRNFRPLLVVFQLQLHWYVISGYNELEVCSWITDFLALTERTVWDTFVKYKSIKPFAFRDLDFPFKCCIVHGYRFKHILFWKIHPSYHLSSLWVWLHCQAVCSHECTNL